MPDFLPNLGPAEYLLPLTLTDKALAEGAQQIPIPPDDPESIYLLHHAGIRQAVYQGTRILDRLCDKPHSQVEYFPPSLLYRHVLDLGDSIATLVRFGSASNGAILLRSLFESVIGLEFMLMDNKIQLDRALCYWVCFHIKQYENHLKHDPATEQGEKFHRLLDSDQRLKRADFPRADHSKERKALEDYLSGQRFKPIWERYKKAKKNKEKGEWYSLCSNAKNVRGLAREIGREPEYALFYQQLSEFAHGTDVITGTLRHEVGGRTSMHQIRGPVTKINMVIVYSLTCLIGSHNLVLRAFFKDDPKFMSAFGEWYLSYRPYYQWSCGLVPDIEGERARPEWHL